MTDNTPIDEFFFWKKFIEDKQDAGESIPCRAHEAMLLAEKKMLFFLMDKYHINNASEKFDLEVLH